RSTALGSMRWSMIWRAAAAATRTSSSFPPAAHRDRAGGNDDDVLAAAAAARQIIDPRIEPGAVDLALLIDEQGRPDLDHQPPRLCEGGGGGGRRSNSLSALGGGEGWGEVGDSRARAGTHLTLPSAARWVPSLSPLKG